MAMRRASLPFLSTLLRSLRHSQSTPLPLPNKPPILFPKYPHPHRRHHKFSSLSSSSSSLETLESAFESATTTDELLSSFAALSSSLPPSSPSLALACLKLGQHLDSTGTQPAKTLELALRSLDILDRTPDHNPLPLAMSLHLAGSASFELKRFNDSLSFLTRANRILSSLDEVDPAGFDLRPVAHAVHLQLANTKTALGRREDALIHLRKCLDLKVSIFDGAGKEVASAYRDLAEAYAAVLDFKQALPLCTKAVEIHKAELGMNSVEVAHDRRLLGVIYTGLEEHDKALKQNEMSQKVLKSWGMSSDLLHAEIDAANIQIALGKFDEAVETLKRVAKETEKDSETKAFVFLSMAKALSNQDKFDAAKRCLEISKEILEKKEDVSPSKVAEAYTEMATVYESMDNEFDTAILLLKRSLRMIERLPQEQHLEGNVSARIGWLLLLTGKVEKAVDYLESAAERMQESFGPKHFGVGYIYNNLGAAYMEMERPQSAAQMFALAKDIMDFSLGPNHTDSIRTCQSLANAYSAMESYSLALEFQQRVIDAWTSHGPSAADELTEASRLFEELKMKAFGSLPEAGAQDGHLLPQGNDVTTTKLAHSNVKG